MPGTCVAESGARKFLAGPAADSPETPRLHELDAFRTHYAPTVAALAAAAADGRDPSTAAPKHLVPSYAALAHAAPPFVPPPPAAPAGTLAKRKRPLFDGDDDRAAAGGSKLRKLDAIFALDA